MEFLNWSVAATVVTPADFLFVARAKHVPAGLVQVISLFKDERYRQKARRKT